MLCVLVLGMAGSEGTRCPAVLCGPKDTAGVSRCWRAVCGLQTGPGLKREVYAETTVALSGRGCWVESGAGIWIFATSSKNGAGLGKNLIKDQLQEVIHIICKDRQYFTHFCWLKTGNDYSYYLCVVLFYCIRIQIVTKAVVLTHGCLVFDQFSSSFPFSKLRVIKSEHGFSRCSGGLQTSSVLIKMQCRQVKPLWYNMNIYVKYTKQTVNTNKYLGFLKPYNQLPA